MKLAKKTLALLLALCLLCGLPLAVSAADEDYFEMVSAKFETDTTIVVTFSEEVDDETPIGSFSTSLRVADPSVPARHFGTAQYKDYVDFTTAKYSAGTAIPGWAMTYQGKVVGQPNSVRYTIKAGAADEALEFLQKYNDKVPNKTFTLEVQIQDNNNSSEAMEGFFSADGSVLYGPAYGKQMAYATLTDERDNYFFTVDSAKFETDTTIVVTFSEEVADSTFNTSFSTSLRVADPSVAARHFGTAQYKDYVDFTTAQYSAGTAIPGWAMTYKEKVAGQPNSVRYTIKAGAADEALEFLQKYNDNVPNKTFTLEVQIQDNNNSSEAMEGFFSADGSVLYGPAYGKQMAYASVTDDRANYFFTIDSAKFETNTTIVVTFSEEVADSTFNKSFSTSLRVADPSVPAHYFGTAQYKDYVDFSTAQYSAGKDVPGWAMAYNEKVEGQPNAVRYTIKDGAADEALEFLQKYNDNVPNKTFTLEVHIQDNDSASEAMEGFFSVDGSVLYGPAFNKQLAYASVTDERPIDSFPLQDRFAKTDSVVLTKDETVDSLMVPAGKTLDLNGFTLTVTANMTSFGDVIDSKDGEGMIKIAKNEDGNNKLVLDIGNDMIALYDNEGYRFYDYTFDAKVAQTTETTIQYAVRLALPSAEAYALLDDADNYKMLTVSLVLTGMDPIDYNFRQTTVDEYVTKSSTNPSKAYGLALTVSGLDKIEQAGLELSASACLALPGATIANAY